MKEIYLAGGCFWGVQKFFDQFNGVLNTTVGYANGHSDNPQYKDVKAGITGHAETLKIQYDESVISLKDLLNYYYMIVDPISINQQGEDKGISYRSGIYYVDDKNLDIINEVTSHEQLKYKDKFAVEILPLSNFYDAEEYHQKYLEKNPNGYCHIHKEMFNITK